MLVSIVCYSIFACKNNRTLRQSTYSLLISWDKSIVIWNTNWQSKEQIWWNQSGIYKERKTIGSARVEDIRESRK